MVQKSQQREEREEKQQKQGNNNNRVSGGAKKTKKSGEKKIRTYGTRAMVMAGTALKTSSGLTKSSFRYNKYGRIVSIKMSDRAKREKRLAKAGFIPKKGVFKLFKKSDGKKVRKMTRKTARK